MVFSFRNVGLTARGLLLVASIAVAACGTKGGYYKDDGPPRGVDPADIARLTIPCKARTVTASAVLPHGMAGNFMGVEPPAVNRTICLP